MKTKVITLCGSSRYCDIMAVCAWFLEKEELAISMDLHLLPSWYCKVHDHLAEHEGVADQMDELHLRKIDISDEIFVVNFDNYIGESTSKEIAYAKKKNKPIRYMSDDYIGTMVLKVLANISTSTEAGEQPGKYQNGVPCSHPGCKDHLNHPCEICGRIGAEGTGMLPD